MLNATESIQSKKVFSGKILTFNGICCIQSKYGYSKYLKYSKNKEKIMKNIDLHIDGMTCQGCVASLEKLLSAVQGIHAVQVDLKKQSAQLEIDEHCVQITEVIDVIENAGFDARLK